MTTIGQDSNTDIILRTLDENIKDFLSRDGWANFSSVDDLRKIFKYNSFYMTENHATNDVINDRLTEFAKIFIAGEEGEFEQFKTKLKSYDFSSTCGLVWTTNYFAYRCRTCCLSPSMSLCSACFNNGNHIGHDFNKFKSQAGGACDCGNPYVMKEFGYCKHHGPSKIIQQRDPPNALVRRLEMIMPIYLKCILFSCWSLIQNIDMDDSSFNISSSAGSTNDVLLSALTFINDLLSCGWVVQKLLANVMIDKFEFSSFLQDVQNTDQYYAYKTTLQSDPGFKFPHGKIELQTLTHENLVDGYLFVCVKLRFPENLITFLIGLLTIEQYKDKFVYSYLNHYSRMASTILIHAKTVRNGQDTSYNMNNRIVHISVQLFSGEVLALKMVKERQLHYLIVHCLLNMFYTALTRLDTNDNFVINCETPMIQNNVFWPLISDLTNLVTHKSVVDYFIADIEFMNDWTKLLKFMQFMNFFVLKEGNHIEYETMAFFHAYTMEIEISANSMWNIWHHYRDSDDRDSGLRLVRIFVKSLSDFLENLGEFQTSVISHPTRMPLSFHLPLMRNVACFVSLGLVYHNIPLSSLLESMTQDQVRRWFKEVVNTLLGCQEVLIGYWVRNGQSVRTSTTYYIHSQFCYALIDMDIFSAQICASILPPSTVIYILTDPSQLLKGIDFSTKFYVRSNDEFQKMTLGSTTAVSSATKLQNRNRAEKFSLEKQPLALDSWLINLCWILDLRNEMRVDDRSKLRKEVCCELCPEPVKRSDLSHRLPEKTGINVQISPDVDSILEEVANYTAPTFDEYSGNLQSGLYTFKPELWDTDYDPLFQSLRSVTKRDAADALAKYREYYRQKQNISQANSLWPPYRTPLPPHSQLAGLENILHCKDLTYIIFCCLNMFINNDPIVSEDSVSLIIHIVLRSISLQDTPKDVSEESTFCRFPKNQYIVNNAHTNLRYKIELFSETSIDDLNIQMETETNGQAVQRDSILSLLLKIHSKLHALRLQSGGKSIVSLTKSSKMLKVYPITVVDDTANFASISKLKEPMETDQNVLSNTTTSTGAEVQQENIRWDKKLHVAETNLNTSNRQGSVLDEKAVEYFYFFPLVYEYNPNNLFMANETGVGINWGDGVDFVGHLLDVISSKNDENSVALFELINFIQERIGDQNRVDASADNSGEIQEEADQPIEDGVKGSTVLDPMQEKKQKALDRRRRVIANMAMKQKAFASAHNIDMDNEDIINKDDEIMFECVICQLKSNPKKDKMVLLGLLCSSETLKYMHNVANSDMNINRRTFCQNLQFNLPVLSHGMIIQTCSHVVHQDCFDKYKAQRPAVTRMRRTITCPLCRRDVHHLTPISGVSDDHPPKRQSIISPPGVPQFNTSLLSSLKHALLSVFDNPQNTLSNNTIDDSFNKSQISRMLISNQASCLLRSQLELEIIICLTTPDQYSTIIRRCIFPEFIAYNRTLNTNISLVVFQADCLLGTSFWNDIPGEEKDSESMNNHFLFQAPADVLLNFIPYIWPYEDWYTIILKSTILLAYVKCLVYIFAKMEDLEYTMWTNSSGFMKADQTDMYLFSKHLKLVMNKCEALHSQYSTSAVEPTNSMTEVEQTDSKVTDLVQFLLPLMRFAAVLKLRMIKATHVPDDFPIQPISKNQDPYKELESICFYLDLMEPSKLEEKPMDKLMSLITRCLSVTQYDNFSDVLDKFVTEEFINVYLNEKKNNHYIDILNLGNELNPPKLIELPNCYDDLFNANHAVKCIKGGKPAVHTFSENGLCLICGKLICLNCETMPTAFNEHSKSCCYGIGLIIDINTSIIHVLLNNEISQWGSVYLDYYGEEDLELKRGRPLFINIKRFKLLEQQWLTHSFKHVVKSWRRIS